MDLSERPVPVELPVLRWGAADAPVRVLLVHGLTSSGAVWWEVADELARAGCRVTAVDLRGHGAAPATVGYRLAELAADLAEVGDGGWDVVAGHSLGGAAVVTAAAAGWLASRAYLLVDPVLEVSEAEAERYVTGITAELTTPAEVFARENPRWHPETVRLKVAAAAACSPYVVERCLRDNTPWELLPLVERMGAPVTVLGADPAVEGPSFTAAHAAALPPHASFRVVPGCGHSVYRDDPASVIAAVRAAAGV
ncbi:pimeloyl-ACP methyl ester carboxylesterase [Catenuloplanes nepalensis]|uniref:Pimeloyl-ACP methyl ester carboxylesterase n=1 Tax=Catenuloplanes nepalensis TaxID=587533 RepID=A0ABT9MT12_9ACTN|nr:alpha/beta hydrolase [Catenuloplanes nepalensis]MDP9794550.1 pimeloyl-ACP methyl ester carboxylesterase [Catenuloplanes nepalensis]